MYLIDTDELYLHNIVHAGIKNHVWKIKSMTSNNAVLITRKNDIVLN